MATPVRRDGPAHPPARLGRRCHQQHPGRSAAHRRGHRRGGDRRGVPAPASGRQWRRGAAASASPGASTAAGASAATGDCPTSQPPALPAGETRTVTLTTPKGAIVLKVEADLSPIAAGNFVALAACGFYDGSPSIAPRPSRTGPPSSSRAVIRPGPGPVVPVTRSRTSRSRRRTSGAPSRWPGTSAPDCVGSQFFIVLDDKDGAILSSANTYQIIGNVTSGMDTADAIFAASGGVELPANPIPITDRDGRKPVAPAARRPRP